MFAVWGIMIYYLDRIAADTILRNIWSLYLWLNIVLEREKQLFPLSETSSIFIDFLHEKLKNDLMTANRERVLVIMHKQGKLCN